MVYELAKGGRGLGKGDHGAFCHRVGASSLSNSMPEIANVTGRVLPCYRRRILGLRFADVTIRIVELAVEKSHPSIPPGPERSVTARVISAVGR
jgi:hypothetical protein